MNRWSSYSQGDTQLQSEGDSRFIGTDMVRDRPLLPDGMLSRTENNRCREGPCKPRLGTIQPADFQPVFEGPIVGSGIYSNPNGEEIMLVATLGADYVWALQFGKDPIQIDLFAGQTITLVVGVEFVQAFDKVLLLRRPIGSWPPLVWDGINTNTFNPVALSTNGKDLIPATWHGEPFMNRILLYNAQYSIIPWRDQVAMTDSLDYTSWDDDAQKFRINAGESDWITRIWPYYKGTVIIGKRRSIHIMANFTTDPNLMEQHILSAKIGWLATKCGVEDGADVLFLSEPGGIYRLSELVQEQISTEPIPVSEPITPLINRIHWPQAAIWACAEKLGDYSYFAYPIDGAGNGCNAMSVYNNVTRQWESDKDSWLDPTFRIKALHVTNYNRERRLFALDYDAKRIYVLNEGTVDEINNDILPIHHLVEFRGYAVGDATGFKRFQRAALALSTADPEVTVTAITDGVNEEKVLTSSPIRKDALKFYPHGHSDFNTDTGDPLESMREDYSQVEGSNFAGQDFESLPVGDVTSLPGSGRVIQGPKQQALVRLPMRVNGRWASLRVENTQGSCDILAVGVEAIAISETGVAA